MILEIQTYAGEIDDGLHASSLEFLGVANAGALEDQWA